MIPLRSMKRNPSPGLPTLFDRPKYRQRKIIERMFGWLKENRRIVTRVDKLAKSYAAMVSLACAMRCLRKLFSYRAKHNRPLFSESSVALSQTYLFHQARQSKAAQAATISRGHVSPSQVCSTFTLTASLSGS